MLACQVQGHDLGFRFSGLGFRVRTCYTSPFLRVQGMANRNK